MGVTMEIGGSRGDLGTLVHGDCHPLLCRLAGLGDLDLFLMGPRHAADAHNKHTLFSRSEAFTKSEIGTAIRSHAQFQLDASAEYKWE